MLITRTVRKAFLSRDVETSQAGRFQLINAIARRFGFRLYNQNLIWFEEVDRLSSEWLARPYSEQPLKDRHFILYSMAKSVANLLGDTAECGVYYGASSFLICLATVSSSNPTHHVFDSFAGLSQPDANDLISTDRQHWRKHDLAVPQPIVEANLNCFDFVRYHAGWIPDRFHEVAHRQFSFVHIDVDLYQPTHDSLSFFYERMVPGGVILCDDYGFSTCPGATKAFDGFIADKPENRVIHLTSGQGFIIKR